MTPRARVLAAVNRQRPDRVPKEAGFTPVALETVKKHIGHADPGTYFKMEMRGVGFKGPKQQADFSEYLKRMPPGTRIGGEWGTASRPGTFYHFSHHEFPLRHANTIPDLERYPWPDFTPAYRHEHLEADVKRLHDGDWFVSGFSGHIFETAWQIIGMEEFFMKSLENREFVEFVLDKITEQNSFVSRRLAEAGVDMLRTGDDVGMQDRLMMRPQLWRELLKPRLAREIAAARAVNPTLPVWYHSDGNISDIIDDLIEAGVTVLNPVQPECLDLQWVKRRYGSRLAFWGTIGTQTVMPFGTPQQVRDTVKAMIELFAPGLVLAPTHVLEPEVPWENIKAFFDATEEFGKLD